MPPTVNLRIQVSLNYKTSKTQKNRGNFGGFILTNKWPAKPQKDKQYNNYIIILKEKYINQITIFFSICPSEKSYFFVYIFKPFFNLPYYKLLTLYLLDTPCFSFYYG